MSFWITVLGMLGLSVIATVIFSVIVWQFSRHLKLVTQKVRQITDDQDETHLLVPSHDPLHELVQEVNRLQSQIRHQSHQTMRQENELETLIKNLPVGVLVIDRFGQLQIANTAVQELLHRDIRELPHSYLEEITQPELLAMINQVIQQQQSQQKMINFDRGQIRKNIRVQVLYSEIRPQHFQVIVLMTDVSDLVAMSKMQADFVANASHELKTPITAIAGFSETLLEQNSDPATQQQFLTIIKQESDKLVKLIDDILSLSRLRNGQPSELQLTSINLTKLVGKQLDNLGSLAQLNQVELQNKISTNFIITSDSTRLTSVLYNLIANAIKYNRQGGHVIVTAKNNDDTWELCVSDTGIGIPAEQQERIFERFYRVPNDNMQLGTGLGLAIVAEQVAQLDGKIAVDSKLGFGTTIKIKFKGTSVSNRV
ncbi:Signal transduction histidine kinase [Paucilactobacillus hokkaidonensis]|nr:Signal transduction histidine kinase [Paucilactobacillus hokkaidonensis]